MGGFITPKYFAEGGPTGTDTIPAWLSPGEYVMDAQNTAKFFHSLYQCLWELSHKIIIIQLM